MTSAEVWRLHYGDEVLAELEVTEQDQPWLHARVVPHEGFSAVASLFREELRLLNELADEETPEWRDAYRRIRAETRLTSPNGSDVAEYMLHIDGDEAWWRWSDERFDAE